MSWSLICHCQTFCTHVCDLFRGWIKLDSRKSSWRIIYSNRTHYLLIHQAWLKVATGLPCTVRILKARASTIGDEYNVRLRLINLEFINRGVASCSFAWLTLASVGCISRPWFMEDDCFLALLYYDYFLTFPAEVKYIWSRKPTLSTILYIFCRYALLANLLYLFAISKVVDKVNRALTW